MRIIVRLSQKKMPLSLAVMCYCFVGMPASSRPVGGPMVLISMVLAGQFLFTCTLQEVCWPSCGLLLQTSFDMPTLPCEFLCLLMIHPYSPHLFLCQVSLLWWTVCFCGRHTFFYKFRISASGWMEVGPEDVSLSS